MCARAFAVSQDKASPCPIEVDFGVISVKNGPSFTSGFVANRNRLLLSRCIHKRAVSKTLISLVLRVHALIY